VFKLSKIKIWGSAVPISIIFLLIVFYDEFVYAVGYTALPVLRADLKLSYTQVGLLMGLPTVINTFIEPVLMLLGDTSLRKRLILSGGVGMSLTALMIAGVRSFPVLLLAEILSYPSSGAFVTLSQASLMDTNHGREGKMMARWAISGSLANLIAPLIMAGGFALGWGWRWAYVSLFIWGVLLTLSLVKRRLPSQRVHSDSSPKEILLELLQGLWETVQNPKFMRWVILLELADLMMDVFTGFAALYFADVTGLSSTQVALVLSLMMLAGLTADLLLLPLLEKFNGRWIVRISAAMVIPLYAAFLLAPWPLIKVGLVVLIKLSTLGWYAVMEGEAFASVPGRSGTVSAIGSLSGLLMGGLIAALGWIAESVSLQLTMWLLLAGPVALALFVPRPVVESN